MKKLLLSLFLLAGIFTGCEAATPVDHTQTYTFRTDTLYCQREGLNIFGIAYIPEGSMSNGHWSSMHMVFTEKEDLTAIIANLKQQNDYAAGS